MVHNIADVTPNGTATALKAARTPCNWLSISAITGNGADMRVGDSTTSATSGAAIKAGTTFIMEPIGDDQYLDLAQVYLFGATGADKAAILYGTH